MFASSPLFVRRLRSAAAVSALAILAVPAGLAAEPLDKEACSKLQAEKQTLVVLGVDKEFAKGPEWAKANLQQAELDLLKRYLTLDEQLKFRCGMAVVNLQIPDETPDGDDDDDAAPGAARVPLPERRDQAPKPAAAKPVKPAPKPTPKSQSSWNTETAPVEEISPAALDQLELEPISPDISDKVRGGGRG